VNAPVAGTGATNGRSHIAYEMRKVLMLTMNSCCPRNCAGLSSRRRRCPQARGSPQEPACAHQRRPGGGARPPSGRLLSVSLDLWTSEGSPQASKMRERDENGGLEWNVYT